MSQPPMPLPAPETFGPVIITTREVYDAVVRVSAKQDATNGRLDLVSSQLTDMAHDAQDHEARIRTLERGRWPLPSIAALGSIAAVVIALTNHH